MTALQTMNPDKIFNILRHPLRRQLVAILQDNDDISRDHLTTILATAEADEDDEMTEVRRRVRAKLHHNHLPRLADADLIEYDEETVTALPRLETVAQWVPFPRTSQTSART